MGTVSLTLPADGDTIDASDVNTPLNAIAAVINGGIDSTNVTDGGLTPADLTSGTGTSWAWQSFTPTCATLTLGNGTLTGASTQTGKTVQYRMSLLFGTTTSITASNFTFTFPTTPIAAMTSQTLGFPLGQAIILDTSAATYFFGNVVAASSTTGEILLPRADSATYISTQNVMINTNPFTWASGDYIYIVGTYEAA